MCALSSCSPSPLPAVPGNHQSTFHLWICRFGMHPVPRSLGLASVTGPVFKVHPHYSILFWLNTVPLYVSISVSSLQTRKHSNQQRPKVTARPHKIGSQPESTQAVSTSGPAPRSMGPSPRMGEGRLWEWTPAPPGAAPPLLSTGSQCGRGGLPVTLLQVSPERG